MFNNSIKKKGLFNKIIISMLLVSVMFFADFKILGNKDIVRDVKATWDCWNWMGYEKIDGTCWNVTKYDVDYCIELPKCKVIDNRCMCNFFYDKKNDTTEQNENNGDNTDGTNNDGTNNGNTTNPSDGTNTEPKSADCKGILGDPSDENSAAGQLQIIFGILKILAPILAIVFGTVRFGKAVLQDDENATKKASTDFLKSLIAATLLFVLPDIINFILSVAGTYDTCGIS